ncbi:MAG: septum formation inhibitor Maf [Gammaproteobacteria bacterium]|jgi:septum formation protein|nr:septum formation inhibitor Maf [Gammaproteobacteria bacterium]
MDTQQQVKILLASASPRRRELLSQIGVQYDVLAVNVDETARAGESPEVFVQRLAMEKAAAGFLRQTGSPPLSALGADTIVLLGDQILGKPKDKKDGCAMLKSLSGETHQVFTAVALANAQKNLCLLNRSKVTFRTLTDAEIEAYWDSGEPADKAGGYAIQGLAAVFIRKLEGSYTGVMGLPLFETAELLKDFGIELLAVSKKI